MKSQQEGSKILGFAVLCQGCHEHQFVDFIEREDFPLDHIYINFYLLDRQHLDSAIGAYHKAIALNCRAIIRVMQENLPTPVLEQQTFDPLKLTDYICHSTPDKNFLDIGGSLKECFETDVYYSDARGQDFVNRRFLQDEYYECGSYDRVVEHAKGKQHEQEKT